MGESDDDKRKRAWNEAQHRLAKGETPLDRLLSDRGMTKAGWHWVRGADGKIAVVLPNVPNHASGSPEQRELEDQWEKKSIQMHDQQVPIVLPDVPVERGLMRSAVAAFDVVGDGEATKAPPRRKLVVPKFHETSPASTEVQRRSIKRGR